MPQDQPVTTSPIPGGLLVPEKTIAPLPCGPFLPSAAPLFLSFPPVPTIPPYNDRHMPTAERIAVWMRQRLAASGARGFVVGLSGGVDSAVIARLAQLAAPGAVVGAILPCHSDPADERDALLVAKHFSLMTVR